MIYPATPENIEKAVRALKHQDLVAFPTETVYGLGANALEDAAVRKIYAAKGRPANNPLIVHCSSFKQIFNYVVIDNRQAQQLDLLKSFWPGPLTIVLPKNGLISKEVSVNLDSVAIRIPNHPVALSLLEKCPFPLAAPSANVSTYVSATTSEHVEKQLGDKVSMILDGGGTEIGIESTVLSLLGSTPEILRPGYITREQIEKALKTQVLNGHSKNQDGGTYRSPGMMTKHYSPKTPIKFIQTFDKQELPKRVGFISFSGTSDEKYDIEFCKVLILSESSVFEEIARNLFAAIRELDEDNLDLILVDSCDNSGFGVAIMDRLVRATSQ